MIKYAKTAAALTLAAVLTAALTGCGGNQGSPSQSLSSAAQNTSSNGGTGGNFSAENSAASFFSTEHIIRSKVTSADSSAMSVANTVNTWIMDNQTAGGRMPGEGEDTIIFDNGNVTVSGVVTDADTTKLTSGFETLSERLKKDFSYIKTAYVKIYINGSGIAYACVFAEGETQADESDIPGRDDLGKGWKWDGKTAGVSPSGKIVGTYPRTALAGQ